MAERQLSELLAQLKSKFSTLSYPEVSTVLSKAKILLLQLDAVSPAPPSRGNNNKKQAQKQKQKYLFLAVQTYELGALASIRARNPDAFTRYVAQLRPFYELLLVPKSQEHEEQRSKITGLYLLLLLTQGNYPEFHSELERLAAAPDCDVEGDIYLGYPVRLERWLMEGSYDRVWKAVMNKGEIPCEEYGIFSEILTSQIRSEIASSSERAYPSLPISSTKSLLFLDSEGAVIEFARLRGWVIRDGQIFFPVTAAEDQAGAEEQKEMSEMVIENALGYARQLETIV